MAPADRIERRQLEKLVSWTFGERLWYWWYLFRLTVREVNFASYLMLDPRIAVPRIDVTGPDRDQGPARPRG